MILPQILLYLKLSLSLSPSPVSFADTSPYAKLYARIKSSCNDVKVEKNVASNEALFQCRSYGIEI